MQRELLLIGEMIEAASDCPGFVEQLRVAYTALEAAPGPGDATAG